MIFLFFPLLGLCAGLATGYYAQHKQVTPTIKFVKENEKEGILKKYSIKIDETAECATCSEKVTVSNLGMVKSTAEKSILICSKPQCMITKNIYF